MPPNIVAWTLNSSRILNIPAGGSDFWFNIAKIGQACYSILYSSKQWSNACEFTLFEVRTRQIRV